MAYSKIIPPTSASFPTNFRAPANGDLPLTSDEWDMTERFANAFSAMELHGLFPFEHVTGSSATNTCAVAVPQAGLVMFFGSVNCISASMVDYSAPRWTQTGINASTTAVAAASPYDALILSASGGSAGGYRYITSNGTLPTTHYVSEVAVPEDMAWNKNIREFQSVGYNLSSDGFVESISGSTVFKPFQSASCSPSRIAFDDTGTYGLVGFSTQIDGSNNTRKVLLSSDSGNTYAALLHNLSGSNQSCFGVGWDSARQQWVMLRGNNVYVCADKTNPVNWTLKQTFPASSTVNSNQGLVVTPAGNYIVLAYETAAISRLWVSADGGGTWKNMGALGGTPARLTYSNGFVFLRASTYGKISRRIALP